MLLIKNAVFFLHVLIFCFSARHTDSRVIFLNGGRVVSDSDRIRQLMDEHERELLAYAYAILKDAMLAEDAVQHAFVKMMSGRMTEIERPRAWLYKVIRNYCFDELRRNRLLDRVCRLEALPSESSDCLADEPDKAMDESEKYSGMLSALSRLTPEMREIVMLKFSQGKSYREIADITGYSVSNIGFRLHSALAKLRSMLTEGSL